MIKPGMNLFFHSMVESQAADTIRRMLDDRAELVYFRWPAPFTDLRLDNLEEMSFGQRVVATDDREVFDLEALWASEESSRHILIENLHILAHSGADPTSFYRRLLSSCNYYSDRRNISFILSCARVPAVFIRENCFLHRWKFIDCNADPEGTEEPGGKWDKLFRTLRDTFPQLEPHHLRKIKTHFGGDYRDELLRVPGFERFVGGLIDSSLPFSSEVYVPDHSSDGGFDLESAGRIKEHLESVVVGQGEAVQRVVDATLLACSPFRDDPRPQAIFLFVGPSGVGKTRICQELARFLPGYRFLQINLAEHSDRSAVNKLIGLGRGYEDSEYGGILTEPVRLYPKHVVLFDELDHAHPSVLLLFYKIFEGAIKDGRGRDVSFRDCFIVMTTNKGLVAERLPTDQKRKAIEEKLVEDGTAASTGKSIFSQPFLGRIQNIIQFNHLSPRSMLEIAVQYFRDRIDRPYHRQHGVKIRFLPGRSMPGLMEQGIVSAEFAFFELWTLLGMQDQDQGARRLFQLMDACLIHPLELFRIKYRSSLKPGFQIKIHFDPFWPPVMDYDEATVLLIDDDPTELDKLRNIVANKAVSIHREDFNVDLEQADCAVILLDLLQDGEMVGKRVLSRIRDAGIDAPVCVYSSLPAGPQLDQLKSSLWEFGIAGYIAKSDSEETIRLKLFDAIRQYCLSRKSKTERAIESVNLEFPIEVGEDEVHLNLHRKPL